MRADPFAVFRGRDSASARTGIECFAHARTRASWIPRCFRDTRYVRACIRQRSKRSARITYSYTLSSSHFGGIMAWPSEFTGCSITRELSLSQCDTTYLKLPSVHPVDGRTTVARDRWRRPGGRRSKDTRPSTAARFAKFLRRLTRRFIA